MRWGWLAVSKQHLGLLLTLSCFGVGQSAAQMMPPDMIEKDIRAEVAAAFAEPYGQLLLEEYATAVQAAAADACVIEKGIELTDVVRIAKERLIERGGDMYVLVQRLLPRDAYDRAFEALAGAGASAEYEELRKNPDVIRYEELLRRSRLVHLVIYVVEFVDRTALIARIPIKRFAPLDTGDQALLDADPSGAAQDAADAFVKQANSPALNRYIELYEHAEKALDNAFKESPGVLNMGPRDFLPGIDRDFEDLCLKPS